METVLYVLAETVRALAIMTQPTMPESSSRLLDQLAVPEGERGFDRLSPDLALRPGVDLPEPRGVFPRYRDEE